MDINARVVLDHGFIRVIDYMGNDSAVVQSARVSYGQGTKTIRDDEALINYLMRHNHTTPFEMCEIKFHIKLPIFVARQWIRHRTANVNEYSARYSVVSDDFYVPSQICTQSESNKQGSGCPLPPELNHRMREQIIATSELCYKNYKAMIDDGVSREIARTVLPVNFYTEWYWKIDLHNLLHFLQLRMKKNAQYEIRAYASVIALIVQQWMPLTFEAFLKYRFNSTTFSSEQLKIVQRMIKGESVTMEDSKMTKGEWTDFCKTLNIFC